jgi:hypothetical protein
MKTVEACFDDGTNAQLQKRNGFAALMKDRADRLTRRSLGMCGVVASHAVVFKAQEYRASKTGTRHRKWPDRNSGQARGFQSH